MLASIARGARGARCVDRKDASGWSCEKAVTWDGLVGDYVWIAPVAAVVIVGLCAALAYLTRPKRRTVRRRVRNF
jgi:hypothetical protein